MSHFEFVMRGRVHILQAALCALNLGAGALRFWTTMPSGRFTSASSHFKQQFLHPRTTSCRREEWGAGRQSLKHQGAPWFAATFRWSLNWCHRLWYI